MPLRKDCGVILLYHGIATPRSRGVENFSGKHIPEAEFRRQMAFLQRHASPISLREMARRLAGGDPLPPGAVAVTFDDTFQSAHHLALPILERLGIPATFFVTTGLVGTSRRFWVDRVEHALNATESSEVVLRWGAGKRAFPLGTRAQRVKSIITIKAAMKRMPPGRRDRVLAEILDHAPAAYPDRRVANYANMTWRDVKALDRPPRYEVGGHSVNHEILSYLDPSFLRREVRGCLNQLRRRLGRRVDLFSYPEGGRRHYNAAVIRELRRAGVRICPTAIPGINRPGTSPFLLKRIMVGFMGEAFPSHLFRR